MPRFTRNTTLQSATTAVEDPRQDKMPRSSTLASDSDLEDRAHMLSAEEFARCMDVDVESGLSDAQVQERLQRYGVNELEGGEGVSWVSVLVSQIVNAMVMVLVLSLIVSLAIQSWIEGGVIAAVVVVNITVGFLQQYSAEKTMDSLRSLASPSARVIRSAHNSTIAAPQLVPGDIVDLRTGDVVPADVRILEAANFETDESLLTGESLPVSKDASAMFPHGDDIGVGDRVNMAFASSTVTKGRARGVVAATGMHTEIGAIAASLQGGGATRLRRMRSGSEAPRRRERFERFVSAAAHTTASKIGHFLGVNVGTPLQRRLSQLAVGLFWLAVVFAVVVEAANQFSSRKEVIIYAVSTGLSMIPASLVVVLTITLAIGTKRMVERHVIVRKLDSLEALGAVTDVCSDKTGTLTQGRMVTRKAWLPSMGTFALDETSDPFNPHDGALSFSKSAPATSGDKAEGVSVNLSAPPSKELEALLNCAALCNLAHVFEEPRGKGSEKEKAVEDPKWAATGDPTEIAIQVFAHRFDHGRTTLLSRGHQQLVEFPFSSEVKRMSVLFASPEGSKPARMAYMKGAVERILDACVSVLLASGPTPLNEKIEEDIMRNVEAMANQGLRVLALASREWEGDVEGVDREQVEQGMMLVGLMGIYDPPRPESKGAVEECRQAGIEVHMLTGDHPGTAVAIAKEIGIIPADATDLPPYTVTTASAFDALSDEEIDALPMLPLVIGRCAPSTKVRMIDALHRRRRFAAMTGDGVNDSPSLSRADVGIAMGSGSDVAKSASDIVLTDDNFVSITAAIEEGRRSFDNITKFVVHLLATNVLQAIVLLIGLIFKDKENLSVFPLSPVEVLWVVVMTSGPPAMGLGMCRAAPNIMQRPPHDANRGIFTNEVFMDMVAYGIIGGGVGIGAFTLVVHAFGGGDLGLDACNTSRAGCETVFRARATCFATVCTVALLLAWELLDLRRSSFAMTPGAKRPLTQWMRDAWANQVLFWSLVIGFLLIFPLIYIPVINDVVFLHAPISWEWSIVFISALIFIVASELYKWAKRIYFRRVEKRNAASTATTDVTVDGQV